MTSGLPGLVALLRYLRALKLLRQPHQILGGPKMSTRLQAEERFEPTPALPGAPADTHISIIQAQSYSTSTNQGIWSIQWGTSGDQERLIRKKFKGHITVFFRCDASDATRGLWEGGGGLIKQKIKPKL